MKQEEKLEGIPANRFAITGRGQTILGHGPLDFPLSYRSSNVVGGGRCQGALKNRLSEKKKTWSHAIESIPTSKYPLKTGAGKSKITYTGYAECEIWVISLFNETG
jgi:hypothetical protein